MADKFAFSMWVYNDIREFTPDEMKIWRDCGMNIPLAPKTYIGRDDPSVLLPWLDRAREYGIRLIANYEGISYSDYKKLGREGYIAKVRPLIDALSSHPALYGFYVGDEPSCREDLEASADVIGIHKQLAPHLTPFLNYTGSMTGFSDADRGGRTLDEWMKYVKERTGTEMICFDVYDQQINDGGGKTMFFDAVKKMVDAGKACETDVWGCLISTGGHVYREPTEVDMKWQIHMAAALGLRGVLWFKFYDRDFANDGYGSPIDEFGNPTQAFYGIYRTQRRFMNHYGEFIMKMKHKKTYSVKLDRGVFPIFKPGDHDLIKEINADDETIVSFFDGDDGYEYMCVCNSEYRHYGSVKYTIDPSKCALYNVRGNGKDVGVLCDDVNPEGATVLESVMHAAGFQMIRIVRK
ncbi:MAG: hypothetical protein IKH09_04635 [Clostridia bacterium]|nr:hypothetical protein [Clostridia bacterium]